MPTGHAKSLQGSTNQKHLDRSKESFEKKWPLHVPLTRDHVTSLIPHFRRRGLLPKYRRKSETHSKAKRKLDHKRNVATYLKTKRKHDAMRKNATYLDMKRKPDVKRKNVTYLEMKRKPNVKQKDATHMEMRRKPDDLHKSATYSELKRKLHTKRKSLTKSEWKRIMEARKIRDEIINNMLEDRAIETEELEGLRPANASELVERAMETKQVAEFLNGTDGHIWNRKARWAEYDPNYDWENGGTDNSMSVGNILSHT